MVGDLASAGEGEPSEDTPFALWDDLEYLWESLGLPERPLWNVDGVGRRPAAEKAKLAALPIGLVAGAGGFIGFVVWLGAWMNDHWGIYAVVPQAVLMLAVVCGAAVERRRRWEERRSRGLRMPLSRLDSVDHREFESIVRDLMRRDGFTAERVGRGGDDACDVRGVDSDGRIWAVQCKHRRDGWTGKATGVEVLQQVNGTAEPVHGARFAVIVTNGRFSKPAVAWGARYGIRLVDRHALREWADERRPLWEVLGNVRRPRRLPGRAR
ncbi:restriction endonuclease [Streptomyces scopuliridis]|uniref:restriction endonuclease n=1 Tax=Streptomyces scopuliridis TaxID=452529 RepID=UPI0036921916